MAVRNQDVAGQRDHAEALSCRRLWASVVRTAADDLFSGWGKHDTKKRYYMGSMASAEAWFKSDVSDVGSFLWICDILDLSAEAIRKSLLSGNYEHSRGKYASLIKQYNTRAKKEVGDVGPEDQDA